MAIPIKKEAPSTAKSTPAQKPARSLSPFEEMDQMFDRFFRSGWMSPMSWEKPSWATLAPAFEGKTPKVDIIERDNEILVRAELPGVDKKDVDISLSNNTVTIKGSTRAESKQEEGDYYRCEISSGSFSRTLALPGEVDSDKAKAEFKDGLLEIVLPKKEKSKRRTIKVS